MVEAVGESVARQAQVENPKVMELRLQVRDLLREVDPKVVVSMVRKGFEDRIEEMKRDQKPGQDDGKIRSLDWWRSAVLSS